MISYQVASIKETIRVFNPLTFTDLDMTSIILYNNVNKSDKI